MTSKRKICKFLFRFLKTHNSSRIFRPNQRFIKIIDEFKRYKVKQIGRFVKKNPILAAPTGHNDVIMTSKRKICKFVFRFLKPDI